MLVELHHIGVAFKHLTFSETSAAAAAAFARLWVEFVSRVCWLGEAAAVVGVRVGAGVARRRYRAECAAAIREGGVERAWEGLIGRLLLESTELVARWLDKDGERPRGGELEAELRKAGIECPRFDQIAATVATLTG